MLIAMSRLWCSIVSRLCRLRSCKLWLSRCTPTCAIVATTAHTSLVGTRQAPGSRRLTTFLWHTIRCTASTNSMCVLARVCRASNGRGGCPLQRWTLAGLLLVLAPIAWWLLLLLLLLLLLCRRWRPLVLLVLLWQGLVGRWLKLLLRLLLRRRRQVCRLLGWLQLLGVVLCWVLRRPVLLVLLLLRLLLILLGWTWWVHAIWA